MVARLLEAGHAVTVFDTRAEARAALAEQGAHAVESPREVGRGGDRARQPASPEIVHSVATGDDGLLGGASMRRYVDLSTTDHGFRLALMAKDVRLCLAEAQRREVPMLLGSTVDQLWGLGERQAADGDDCTAIVRIFEDWAGATIAGGEASGD